MIASITEKDKQKNASDISFVGSLYSEKNPLRHTKGLSEYAKGYIDALVEKCDYYLNHEEERRQIALNGYRKVCEHHTYYHRMKEMIAALTIT